MVATLINSLRVPRTSTAGSSGAAASAATGASASAASASRGADGGASQPLLRAAPYHASLSQAAKMGTHRAFVGDEVQVVVATTGA